MIQKTLPNNFSIKHNQIIATEDQNMDHRLSSNVMGVTVKSTRGLLLSKPYQPLVTLPTSSKINAIERKGSLVVSIKNHGNWFYFFDITTITIQFNSLNLTNKVF